MAGGKGKSVKQKAKTTWVACAARREEEPPSSVTVSDAVSALKSQFSLTVPLSVFC